MIRYVYVASLIDIMQLDGLLPVRPRDRMRFGLRCGHGMPPVKPVKPVKRSIYPIAECSPHESELCN
jgi:hypothetical protein